MLQCNNSGDHPMFLSRPPKGAMSAWLTYATALTRMQLSAAEVIMHRSQRIASGSMTPPEAMGMVMEKLTAFASSAERATVAAARGGDAVGIATAALRPYGSKTRSNARKLRR
jgi:hypothetical protein